MVLDLLEHEPAGYNPKNFEYNQNLKIASNTKNQRETPKTYENIQKHPRTPQPSLKLPKTHLKPSRNNQTPENTENIQQDQLLVDRCA